MLQSTDIQIRFKLAWHIWNIDNYKKTAGKCILKRK